MKRSVSPTAPTSATKRFQVKSNRYIPSAEVSTGFDALLYDELMLHIFSYLAAQDLCVIQSCCRRWFRLSLDDQLWKQLYLDVYGRIRLRGSKGGSSSSPPAASARIPGIKERDTLPLPQRTKFSPQIDWKWMYRINSNWRNGKCQTEIMRSSNGTSNVEAASPSFSPILLSGDTVYASAASQTKPSDISIFNQHQPPCTVRSQKIDADRLGNITCFAQDQSKQLDNDVLDKTLCVFYDTGALSIFKSNRMDRGRYEETAALTPEPSERTRPITSAVYHDPILITMSASFNISVYSVTCNMISLKQSLSSFTSYPPTSLVLTLPSPQSYKLVIAYSVPVYPSHWGAAMTEILISSKSCTVSSSKTRRAFELPLGWIDDSALAMAREQWDRKIKHVQVTETDGKWVLIAGTDNVIQVYRIPMRRSSASVGQLTFVRNLHGHQARIGGMALADGRCVSMGEDGCVWVWDLESEWEVEVCAGHSPPNGQVVRVAFDERRILLAYSNTLSTYCFDI